MKNRQLYFWMITVILSITQCSPAKETKTDNFARALADSEMKRNPEAWMIDFQVSPKWSYVNGLVGKAILEVWRATGDVEYFNYVKQYADTLIDNQGNISGYDMEKFNLDKINSGKILFTLYEETKDQRYLTAIKTLREQVRLQPRVPQGGFWHKKIYTHQMWLDGLYMCTPFYAQYASTFGEPEAFDDIALQFTLLRDHARDSITGLYYHGWDATASIFWADPETGLSENFWGRGIGWFYMALIDVLDFFPPDHPKRQKLLDMFLDLSETITNYQDTETGLWYQVPDKPNEEGNYLEGSCAAMYTYGLAKGIIKGYLPDSYLSAAKKAYRGIMKNLIVFHPDGEVELLNCCASAGLGPEDNLVRDGSFKYYIEEKRRSNDGKGTGPLIMASLLFEQNPKLTISH